MNLIQRLRARIAEIDSELRQMDQGVRDQGRKDLLASEKRRFEELSVERTAIETRLAQLMDEEERREAAARAHREINSGHFSAGADTIYQRHNGVSYFRDLALSAMPADPRGHEAARRLAEHAQVVERAADDLPREFRVNPNRTDGQGGYFVPPLWLVDEYVGFLRAGRALADLCRTMSLPGGTDSINIPKVATGAATAIQTADAAAVQSTDLTDTSVSAPVRTIAGQQDLSMQLLDQSPVAFDEVVFQDLIADYNQKLDLQLISGSGSSGQVKGIANVSGINAVTYTDASPSVPELVLPLGQAASLVATQRFMPVTGHVMHPRRWYWITTALDTQNRPLINPEGADGTNSIAVFNANAAQGLAGKIGGIPVIVDANVPTNLGAGTNQDEIFTAKWDDLYLWEGELRSRALTEVLSGTLQVRLQVYNYIAFMADRYPVAIATINGTGLIGPSGF